MAFAVHSTRGDSQMLACAKRGVVQVTEVATSGGGLENVSSDNDQQTRDHDLLK